MCACVLSHFRRVRLFATLWSVAHQAPLSIGLSRQEYWSGLPCPPLGDLPNPGTELASLMSPAFIGRLFTTGPPGKPFELQRQNQMASLSIHHITRTAPGCHTRVSIPLGRKTLPQLRQVGSQRTPDHTDHIQEIPKYPVPVQASGSLSEGRSVQSLSRL